MDKHALRIEIFNSTLDVLRQGWYVASTGKKVDLPPVEEVMADASMYSEPFHVLIDPIEPVTTEVRVENSDCVLAAKRLIDQGYKPAPRTRIPPARRGCKDRPNSASQACSPGR